MKVFVKSFFHRNRSNGTRTFPPGLLTDALNEYYDQNREVLVHYRDFGSKACVLCQRDMDVVRHTVEVLVQERIIGLRNAREARRTVVKDFAEELSKPIDLKEETSSSLLDDLFSLYDRLFRRKKRSA